MLCGSVSDERVMVSHLVLPKQSGTHNTVEMTDDANHDAFLIESGLQVLGWIHTHPTQTAFLSSVDLHTQFGYQALLPEAAAVVCAPIYGVNKWLRLTPEGMKLVGDCTFRGFHEHVSKSRLFTQALGVEYTQTKVIVIDLRQSPTDPASVTSGAVGGQHPRRCELLPRWRWSISSRCSPPWTGFREKQRKTLIPPKL